MLIHSPTVINDPGPTEFFEKLTNLIIIDSEELWLLTLPLR